MTNNRDIAITSIKYEEVSVSKLSYLIEVCLQGNIVNIAADLDSIYMYFNVDKFRICFHNNIYTGSFISAENEESIEKAKEVADFLEKHFAKSQK